MIRERIYQYMLKKSISHTTLCNDLGLQISNFNAFIRGKRTLPYKNFVSVLRYLSLSIGAPSSGFTVNPPEIMSVVFRNTIICRGIKLSEVESITGICQSSLSSIITGNRTTSTKNLDKIISALGLDIVPYKKTSTK